MMNEHAYFHWDLLRQPLQTSQFGMGAPFFDVSSILELRKEKSRDAARSRRGKENYEFYELAKLLPLPAAITSQLDKASIIRLTISYLKLRDFSSHGDPQWTQEGGMGVNKLSKTHHQSRLDIMDPFESRQGTHILQSLDGFAFILGSDGRFLYISETVSIYLGLSQVEMAGSSIFEYVHPQDHTELAEQLGLCMVPIGPSRSPHGSGSDDGSSPATPRPGSPSEKGYMMVRSPEKGNHKSFSLRMKSTLTKRGVHVKTSGYRVVHVLGTLRQQSPFGLRAAGQGTSNCNIPAANSNSNTSEAPPLLGMVGMAIALPPPTITELRLELDTFITKLSPDFKVIYCEPIINDLMDLSVEDVTDRLLYDLCHAADLKSLRRSHLDTVRSQLSRVVDEVRFGLDKAMTHYESCWSLSCLILNTIVLNKGQALTDYYRLMNRHGGYIWIQTCATTLLNNKNADDQSILAINFVVSGMESSNCAMDLWQLTGDATSSMSSASNSQSREDKLKELRTKKAPCTLSSKTVPDSPRVKSTTSTSNISKDESSKTESKTSETSSPKMPPDHCGEDVEAPSPDKNAGSQDNKNKRRKMENPRKRKRSSSEHQEMEDGDKALNLTQNDPKASVIARNPKNPTTDGQNVDKCVNKRRTDTAVTCQPNDNVTSSSPEDLSVKRSTRRSADRSIIQHSSTAFRNTLSPTAEKHKSNSFLNIQDTSSSNQMSITGSSVKELEAAMNRHLPTSSSTTTFHSQNDKNSFENLIADSTGAVKPFSGITSSGVLVNPQSASTSWLPASSRHGTEMLTASNFLRSLYANRESVIKTNSRSQTSFLNNEPTTSLLLTPPEPDPSTYREQNNSYPYGKSDYSGHSYIYDKETGLETRDMYKDQTNRDQFSFIPYKDHISTAYIDHISSAVYKDHLTSTYKELSPYKDIIPAFTIPSLMSPTGRMHQAYSSFHHHFTVPLPTTNMDACSSITPPSSNSPDTNKHAPNSQQVDPTNYFTDANNACNLAQKQSMNNSLSPSSLSPATPSHHYHHPRHYIDHFYQGVNAVDAAKSGYYSIPSTSAGSLYTDLNQNGSTPVQYETCTRPVIPWY